MAAYVDTPSIQRAHGLSGHLIGDPLGDAHRIAEAIGLSRRYFLGDAITPHYQLPAERLDAAIEAGAIPLDPTAWRRRLEAFARPANARHAAPTNRKVSAPKRPTPCVTRDLFDR